MGVNSTVYCLLNIQGMKKIDINDINWEILGRYIANEATPDEIVHVERWLADDANKQILIRLKKAMAVVDQERFQTEKAWRQVEGRLSGKGTTGKVLYKLYLKVAAVALLLICSVFVISQIIMDGKPETIRFLTLHTGQEMKQFMLPDSSVVYLNKNSSFSYPDEFNDSIRLVKLQGEAYFEVFRKEDQPFVVETNMVGVRVLGTTFNVKAYDSEKDVSVVVTSGLVKISKLDSDKNSLLIGKDEIATLKEQGSIQKEKLKPENNYLAWKTGVLMFRQMSLAEVIEVINRHYDANIFLKNEALFNCKLTATFDNKELDEVVHVLAMTFNLSVEKHSNKIILNGKSCT